MKKIVLVTHGTGGDVKPFIKLGSILRKNGYEVKLITHCIYKQEALNEGINFVAIDTEIEFLNRNKDLAKLSDALKNPHEYLEFNKKYCGGKILEKEYKIIAKECAKDSILIFRHRFSIAALLVAEKYELENISVFLAPNYIQHLQFHEELIGAKMKSYINEIRRNIGLKDIKSWTEWMCMSNKKIGLWPKWFARDEIESIKNGYAVGFFKNENCFKKQSLNIEEQRKLILITGGTSLDVNPDFYNKTIKACEKINIPTVLVTAYDEFVPEKLPENVKRVKEISIRKVLPFVKVIIHHGGIGTSSEALCQGIPQVILPHLVDRPDNAKRLKDIGVAQVFPEINWEVDKIVEGIKKAMESESIKRCLEIKEKQNKINLEENLLRIIENKEILEEIREKKYNDSKVKIKSPKNRAELLKELLKSR